MFRREYFNVMIVDDDPSVLAVSDLVLKRLNYAGARLQITTFANKGAALEYLQGLADSTIIALAIVDVIMETDTAGLELCSYIRSALKNDVTQIIIRTGQPGKAPQRQILEGYEINGYISKAEADSNSLYTTVYSALRSYDWASTSLALYRFFNTLMPGFRSREELIENVRKFILQTTARDPALVSHACFIMDSVRVAFGDLADPAPLNAALASLYDLEGRKLNDAGDRYFIDQKAEDAFTIMLSLAPDTSGLLPRVALVCNTVAVPSEFLVTMWHRSLYALRRFLVIADLFNKQGSRS
ncbi:MAG: response regulator [Myxococcota bacterium]|nr:response regulator [Myxococcota bacterium]